jgi:hypothetical protein
MSSIIRATTTNGLQIAPDNSGSLQLQTNGTTTAVTIDTSQNVGIGTASPTQRLQVDSTGATSTIFSRNGGTNANTNVQFKNSTTSFYLGTNTSGNFAIKYNDADLATSPNMVIDSSGNVLVGTTSQITTGGFNPKLSITNAGNAAFFTTSTNASVMGIQINTNGGDGIKFYNASASNVGNITINSGGTAYGTTSDYRLKENIVPMTGALDKVAQLKPVTYTWKVDGSDGQGFIAHELQAVVPDAVVGEKDAVDAEGNPKYQGIDTSFLVATLTAAIQEQQTIINDLKARIETLEAK